MISIKAYAKVNLSLLIDGKREDGYHTIDTVMQTISLYDTVSISALNSGEISVVCDDESLCGKNNLCFKAAELFFSKANINGGCSINIQKNIPVSAGLGGGSTDAAAVLKGLNTLYGNPFNEFELEELALNLGADVPFFIKGGTARAKGIGEKLTTINNKLDLNLLLIKSGEKPSTVYMYKKFDELGLFSLDNKISDMCENALLTADFNGLICSIFNDFSKVCNYKNIREDLIDNDAICVSLSGSGPTVMGLFKTKDSADKAYEMLRHKYPYVYSVSSVNE